jgi:hypothetical protein
MELVVYDNANKNSDKFRMFFIVVPEGFGDDAPKVDVGKSINNSRVVDDWVFIDVNVLSGAERGDVRVQMAFDHNAFNASLSTRYTMQTTKYTYNQTDRLCDPDSMEDYGPASSAPTTEQCVGSDFTLGLKLEDKYTNKSEKLTLYVLVTEGDGDTGWVIYQYVTINLAACNGQSLPDEAVSEGAEWIWNPSTKECEAPEGWTLIVGENGETTVQKVSDDTSSKQDGGFLEDNLMLVAGGGLGLVIIVILSMMVLGKNGDEDGDFSAAVGGHQMAVAMDPMEAYVQQLIAQGYPEETARAYAAQYAGHFQQQAGP